MSENKLTLIGTGCNSELYAYGQGQNRVVLKVVSSLSKKELRHLKNEFLILKSLDHENILKALRYQQNVAFQGNKMDKQLKNTKNILVLEYAQKGCLLDYMQKHQLDFNTKKQGITFMHDQNIAHRDLKLENLLVFCQNGQISVKISDFGFASQFRRAGKLLTFNQFKGTKKGYMAPEIHLCQKQGLTYDASKCDIFALGVVLFALVLGKLPFQFAVVENKLYKLIIEKKYEQFWSYHQTSLQQEGLRMEQFKQLFQKMVSFQPLERPIIKQIRSHGWIV